MGRTGGGPGRGRSPILIDRSGDRGLYRAILLSIAAHVLVILGVVVWGELDLRPDQDEGSVGVELVGGLPPSLAAGLPKLSSGAPRPEPKRPPQRQVEPEPPKPKPEPEEPRARAEEKPPERPPEEPPDVILPGEARATERPETTPTPTPKPTASPSPKPSASAKPSPTATAKPKPTASPAPTATAKPKPTATAKPKPTAAPTAKPTPPPKPTAKPTPKPTAKPAPTAKPTTAPPAGPAGEGPAPDERPAATPPTRFAGPSPAPGARTDQAQAPASARDAQIAEALARVRERVQGGAGRAGAPSGPGGQGGFETGQVRPGAMPGGVVGGTGGGGGGSGLGGGVGSGELRGADFLLYYNEMIARVRDAWVWAGGAGNLEVKVAFGVTPNGDIVGLRLVQASGDRSYDESVLRALRTVRNLGPPPERHREAFADVELTFRPSDLERP